MKNLKILLVAVLVLNLLWSAYNWVSTPSEPDLGWDEDAAQGLDLAALTNLTKEIRSGQELERRLNEKDSINNLDLNGDDKVDYLSVDEFGDAENKIGYSITTQPEKNQEQEVATITVEKNGSQAEIQVIGNEQIYGKEAIFNASAPLERSQPASNSGSGQVVNNYFAPHPLWISPFYFGFYPSFFMPFPVMPFPMYRQTVVVHHSPGIRPGANSFQQSSPQKIQSPNQGKIADSGIKRSLRNPTGTQKQFQANAKKNIRSGGFGRPKQPSSPSKQLVPSGSNQQNRSVSSFGSNRNRSSGFGSRSFSFGGK